MTANSADSRRHPLTMAYGNFVRSWQRAAATQASLELHCLESGQISYQVGGRAVSLRAGDVLVGYGAFPHWTAAFAGEATGYWLHIPLEIVLEWWLPEVFRQRLFSGWIFKASDPERRALDLGLFRGWHRDLHRGGALERCWAQLEIEARIGRLACGAAEILPGPMAAADSGAAASSPRHRAGGQVAGLSGGPDIGPQEELIPLRVSAGMPSAGSRRSVSQGCPTREQLAAAALMGRYAAEHFTERVLLQDVAQVARLCVASAQKCFVVCFGVTLHRYLLHLRLARAKQLLARSDAKVIDIALESGFPTLSNFYRAFEAAEGRTPSAYRRNRPAAGDFGQAHPRPR